MLKWPNLYYSTSAFAPRYYPKAIIDYANTRGADKVIGGYFPMGLTLERIFGDLPGCRSRKRWPKFLRGQRPPGPGSGLSSGNVDRTPGPGLWVPAIRRSRAVVAPPRPGGTAQESPPRSSAAVSAARSCQPRPPGRYDPSSHTKSDESSKASRDGCRSELHRRASPTTGGTRAESDQLPVGPGHRHRSRRGRRLHHLDAVTNAGVGHRDRHRRPVRPWCRIDDGVG